MISLPFLTDWNIQIGVLLLSDDFMCTFMIGNDLVLPE